MIQTRYHFSDTLSPVLALAIHNGHEMPEILMPYNGIGDAVRYMEEDPHTDTFARLYPNHIIVETSRFAVDLNRPAARAVYQNPEDAWGLNVRSTPLPENMVKVLMCDYLNWYSTLKYEVDRLLSFHPFIVVFDMHSYNHRRKGPNAEPDPQIDNPDIILGRNNMPEQYHSYVEELRINLDGMILPGRTLDVRCDVKFPGGNLSRWLHNTYPGQVLCLAVEFKKIFMDEHSGKLNPVSIQILRNCFHTAAAKWMKDLPLLQH